MATCGTGGRPVEAVVDVLDCFWHPAVARRATSAIAKYVFFIVNLSTLENQRLCALADSAYILGSFFCGCPHQQDSMGNRPFFVE